MFDLDSINGAAHTDSSDLVPPLFRAVDSVLEATMLLRAVASSWLRSSSRIVTRHAPLCSYPPVCVCICANPYHVYIYIMYRVYRFWLIHYVADTLLVRGGGPSFARCPERCVPQSAAQKKMPQKARPC